MSIVRTTASSGTLSSAVEVLTAVCVLNRAVLESLPLEDTHITAHLWSRRTATTRQIQDLEESDNGGFDQGFRREGAHRGGRGVLGGNSNKPKLTVFETLVSDQAAQEDPSLQSC